MKFSFPKLTLPPRAVQPIEQRLIAAFSPVYSNQDLQDQITNAVVDGAGNVSVVLQDDLHLTDLIIPDEITSFTLDGQGKFSIYFPESANPAISVRAETKVHISNVAIKPEERFIPSLFGLRSTSQEQRFIVSAVDVYEAVRLFSSNNNQTWYNVVAEKVSLFVGNKTELAGSGTRLVSCHIQAKGNHSLTVVSGSEANTFDVKTAPPVFLVNGGTLTLDINGEINTLDSSGTNVLLNPYGQSVYSIGRKDVVLGSQFDTNRFTELSKTKLKNHDPDYATLICDFSSSEGISMRSVYQDSRRTSTGGTSTLQTIETLSERAYLFESRVVARDLGSTNGAAYIIKTFVINDGGTATILSSTKDFEAETLGTLGCNHRISAGDNVVLSVTGSFGTDIFWSVTTTVDEQRGDF